MIFEESGKFILKNFGIPLKQKHIIIKTIVNAIMDKIYNIPRISNFSPCHIHVYHLRQLQQYDLDVNQSNCPANNQLHQV